MTGETGNGPDVEAPAGQRQETEVCSITFAPDRQAWLDAAASDGRWYASVAAAIPTAVVRSMRSTARLELGQAESFDADLKD